jgi:hypothetical protein
MHKKKHIYTKNEYKIIQYYNIQEISKHKNTIHLSIYVYVIYWMVKVIHVNLVNVALQKYNL